MFRSAQGAEGIRHRVWGTDLPRCRGETGTGWGAGEEVHAHTLGNTVVT